MLRGLVGGSLALVVLAGCGSDDVAPTFATVFPAKNEPGTVAFAAERVEVIDLTAHVAGIAVAPDAAAEQILAIGNTGTLTVDGSPNAVHVGWLGGACESGVRVVVAAADAGYTMTVKPVEKLGICPAVGVLRAITITFDVPVDAAEVRVTIER